MRATAPVAVLIGLGVALMASTLAVRADDGVPQAQGGVILRETEGPIATSPSDDDGSAAGPGEPLRRLPKLPASRLPSLPVGLGDVSAKESEPAAPQRLPASPALKASIVDRAAPPAATPPSAPADAARPSSTPGKDTSAPLRAMAEPKPVAGAGKAPSPAADEGPQHHVAASDIVRPVDTAAMPQCAHAADAIGISRTVEIDTTTSPRFGHQQINPIDFLNDHEIVLTFDDGPLRHTTVPVLEALAYHCTRATFFMVGKMAIDDPAMAKEVLKQGHTVGTHTWSHADLGKKGLAGLARAKAEVELGLSAVKSALGQTPSPFFRFPYLSMSKPLLPYMQARHIGIFSIDGDSSDYRTHDPAVVQRNILSQLAVHHRGILLFHDIQPSTAHALKTLLTELKNRGYKVVHMVSKTEIETLPEFDDKVRQEREALKLANQASPLRSRTATAHMVPPDGDTTRAPSSTTPPEALPPPPREPAPAPPARSAARASPPKSALQTAAPAPLQANVFQR